MRLDPAVFNRFLATSGIGQAVLWRRAYDCPCRDPYSGAAAPDCPHCHGKGVIWAAPVAANTGLTSMAVSKQWANFGVWETGDVALIVPGDSLLYGAGRFDQIILADSSEPFSTSFRRGENDVLLWPVVALERAFVLGEIDGEPAIIECALPVVNDNGTMTWPDQGEIPDLGQAYSLTGRRRPVYFLYQDLPSDRAHHHGQPLPRKVVARVFDLFGR